MIKINLLKNQARATSSETQYTVAATSVSINSTTGKEALVKVGLMLAFAVVIAAYDMKKQSEANNRYQLAMSELNQQQARLTQLRTETQSLSGVEEKAQELERKLELLKSLAKNRLRDVKALDFLQSLMPERVWLTSIRSQDGKFDLSGLAVTDEDLTKLLKAMETSRYFSEIILLRADSRKMNMSTVKNFEITSKIVMED